MENIPEVKTKPAFKLSLFKILLAAAVITIVVSLVSNPNAMESIYSTAGIVMSIVLVSSIISILYLILAVIIYISTTLEEKRATSKKMILKSIITLVVLGGLYVVANISTNVVGIGSGGNVNNYIPCVVDDQPSMPGCQSGGGSAIRESSRYYGNNYDGNTPPVTDTREFMKVSYSAEIKSRDIGDVMKDIKGAIRDASGRIDTFNTSEKYGYINFVVEKSKFDDFRDEIESLVHAKLYTENISSQNLLGQKQAIEQQAETTTKSLLELQQDQKTLTAKHTTTIANLQKELASVRAQLVLVRQNITNTTDQNEINTLRYQESTLLNQESRTQQSINTENTTFTNKNNTLNQQIAGINSNLGNIAKQDTALTNNVETVNGTIRVQWISLWQMTKIFSPIHPTIIIIVLVLVGLYVAGRKGYFSRVELA